MIAVTEKRPLESADHATAARAVRGATRTAGSRRKGARVESEPAGAAAKRATSQVAGGANASATERSAGSKSLSDREIDLALVQRVQRGDKGAFDLLVLKYQHKIGHLVTRYVKDVSESQDVTQEAFIKAYRGLKNFRGDSAFYTWLYRIAINTAKNHLVTMSRKISDTGIDAADAEQFESGSLLRDNATPEREMMTDEIARVVRDSIAALPEDLRTAITLREFEGMSYEEIASAMECPIGTVRSRIFRAREAIDTNLEPLLDEKRR